MTVYSSYSQSNVYVIFGHGFVTMLGKLLVPRKYRILLSTPALIITEKPQCRRICSKKVTYVENKIKKTYICRLKTFIIYSTCKFYIYTLTIAILFSFAFILKNFIALQYNIIIIIIIFVSITR